MSVLTMNEANEKAYGLSLIGVHREMGGNFQYAFSLLYDLVNIIEPPTALKVFVDNQDLFEEIKAISPAIKIIQLREEQSGFWLKLIRVIIGVSGLKTNSKWVRGRYLALDQSCCDKIFHPFWHTATFVTKTPAFVAIHDVAPKENPGLFSWAARTKLNLLIRSITNHAEKILADSDYGKKAIAKFYSVDERKIQVLPFCPPVKLLQFRERLATVSVNVQSRKVPSRYLLLPGRWGSYKNTQRVIDAIGILKKKHNVGPSLVLCGIKDAEIMKAKEYCKAAGLENDVMVLGFVSDESLAYLYNKADGLIFPTTLGPTSIPVYEAMALGCPVIVSDWSGYPDLVGDAAILVDPFDTNSIASAIQRLYESKELRQQMISKGLARYEKLQNRDRSKILKQVLGCSIN